MGFGGSSHLVLTAQAPPPHPPKGRWPVPSSLDKEEPSWGPQEVHVCPLAHAPCMASPIT